MLNNLKNNMFRFYVQLIDGQYFLLNGKGVYQIGPFTKEQLYGCTAPFAEIWLTIGFRPSTVTHVQPLSVDEVKPAALAAADDHNSQLLLGKPKELNRKNSQELRELFQEYIDRSHLYGAKFEQEFQELLDRFPIKVQVENQYYRKATL